MDCCCCHSSHLWVTQGNLMEQAGRRGIMDENIYHAAREFNLDVFSLNDDDNDDGDSDGDGNDDDDDDDSDNDNSDDNDDDVDGDGDSDGDNGDGNDDGIDGDGDGDGNNFCYQDVNGKNIVHIALESLQSLSLEEGDSLKCGRFIEEAIKLCPTLIYQKDINYDTPLHVAAKFHDGGSLLYQFFNYWYTRSEGNGDRLDLEVPPWKLKNLRGRTPLHEAARTSSLLGLLHMTNSLLNNPRDLNEALSEVDENGETALHMIARYTRIPKLHHEAVIISKFVEENKTAVCMRDRDGLTPILRAAHCGHFWLVSDLIRKHPRSKDIRDYKGRDVWHYICSSPLVGKATAGYMESILKAWEEVSTASHEPMDVLLLQDDDGNTPLHLAIIAHNFEFAHFFITHYVKVVSSNAMLKFVNKKYNKDGLSIVNLIASCGIDIPAKLKEALAEGHNHPLAVMSDEIYEAAKEGDIAKLKDFDYKFMFKNRDGSNVFHIALQHHQILFIEELIGQYIDNVFVLLYVKDSKGDTPLHLAARLPPNEALTFFKLCFNKWTLHRSFSGALSDRVRAPWTDRDSKGNTTLHEAAQFCNYEVIFLESLDGIDYTDVNDNGETVLHVIARSATNAAENYLKNLSEEMQNVVYIKDFEGFTPVLRAVQCGRLGVARLLIQQCPQSIGIFDNKGRTVLHHLRALVVDLVDDISDVLPVWNDFYEHGHLDNLRIAQNQDGNTALHSAIIDGNFDKVKFLMEKCLQSENKRELDIVNKEGHTVFDLVSTQSHIPAMKELHPLVNRRYVKERELMDKLMADDLYKAAIEGSIKIFNGPSESPENDTESMPPKDADYFCSQTPGGSNIVHIALRHGKVNVELFIDTALQKHPILSIRPDSNGDTPLHLAVKWKTGISIVQLLITAAEKFHDVSQNTFYVAPWAVKNYKGSFPIHEALQTGNLEAANALLACDKDAAFRVDDMGGTPLHSLAKNGFSINDDQAEKFVKKLIGITKLAAYKRNNEGLTPLLSAARSGRFQVVRAILKHEPQSAYLRDPRGRTFLHLLHFTGEDVDQSFDSTFKKTAKELFAIAEADAQRLVQDYEGDTPLHYAIKNENSIAAIVFAQRCLESKGQAELGLLNKKGQTIPDLLALHDVPNEIIELMQKKLPEAVYLARSSYGIRKSEMKESANALSVVAALLATMTFAAAFQVPGGTGDDGFPILLSKVAFAIFSVANSTAMCSSMLCLFLLLWVMGIGKTHGSLKVLDISIILLRMSFYLTLVTFTTSVFLVSSEKSLWMGIFVCVLGLLTFLLTFKLPFKTVAKYGGRLGVLIPT